MRSCLELTSTSYHTSPMHFRAPRLTAQHDVQPAAHRSRHVAFGKSRGGRGKEFIAFPVRTPPTQEEKPQQAAPPEQLDATARMTGSWIDWWWKAENIEAINILAKMPWADVDAYNDMGETRLLQACRLARTDLLELFLSLGADPNICEMGRGRRGLVYDDSKTPAAASPPPAAPAAAGFASRAAAKGGGSQQRTVACFGRSPLVVVLQRSFPEEAPVRLLLAHGANPSPPDAGYSTPVALSVRRGQLPALRALLEAGADANQPDYQGSRPLHWAAHEGSVGAMVLLLQYGANPNLPDSSGMPPLLRSAQRGDVASIKVLCRSGSDIQARSGLFGRTALALAAERGHPEACRALLELGADATAKDMGGRVPLEMATGDAVHVLALWEQGQGLGGDGAAAAAAGEGE